MNASFYTGVSGLTAYQEGINRIANNVANVNTIAYKPSTAVFRDLVYTNMDTNGEKKLPVGHGVKAAGSSLSFRQGNMQQTGNPLDFAIVGDGFFAVEDRGTVKYTKNGILDISVEGDASYLVSYDGSYVLDNGGERIEIPMKSVSDKDSNKTGEEIDYTALEEKIGLYTFSNPYGLTPMDGGRFMPTTISGQPQPIEEGGEEGNSAVSLRTYTLEASAVDMADEMAAMMQTQKAYQFSAKVVQTADQIEEIVNNLR